MTINVSQLHGHCPHSAHALLASLLQRCAEPGKECLLYGHDGLVLCTVDVVVLDVVCERTGFVPLLCMHCGGF